MADDITTALTINKSLVELWMHGNPIPGEIIVRIVQVVAYNDTLQDLLPSINLEEE